MAFGKKHVEDRKAWLSSFVPGTFLDSEASRISYDDFVNKVRLPALHPHLPLRRSPLFFQFRKKVQ